MKWVTAKTKRCGKCHKWKRKTSFGPSTQSKSGLKCYCKDCENDVSGRYYAEHRQKIQARRNAPERRAVETATASAYRKTTKGKFSTLKVRANQRGIECTISFGQYVELTRCNSCHYCEKPLPIKGAGLDRKNSSLGYTFENCVPCCWDCNIIRGADRIAYEEMLVVARVLNALRQSAADGQDGELQGPLHAVEPSSPSAVHT